MLPPPFLILTYEVIICQIFKKKFVACGYTGPVCSGEGPENPVSYPGPFVCFGQELFPNMTNVFREKKVLTGRFLCVILYTNRREAAPPGRGPERGDVGAMEPRPNLDNRIAEGPSSRIIGKGSGVFAMPTMNESPRLGTS